MVEEGLTNLEPDKETEPIELILTEVARLVDQRKVVDSPLVIVVLEAEKVTVGDYLSRLFADVFGFRDHTVAEDTGQEEAA